MVRWAAGGRGRLEQAAMALYAERGYDATTVAEIAKRAGLTERTFFRHFADKREVLFSGSKALEELMARAVAEAPATLAPIDAAGQGVQAAAAVFEQRRPFAQQRQRIIAANVDLQERELIKMATLSAALAATLRERGVPDPAASLAAEAAVAVFKITFERWVDEANDRDFLTIARESLDELKTVASGSGTT